MDQWFGASVHGCFDGIKMSKMLFRLHSSCLRREAPVCTRPNYFRLVARRRPQIGVASLEVATRRREEFVETLPDRSTMLSDDLVDLPVILDEELGRLPSKLRQAVVLCHLQWKTYAQAAREMGCSIGKVAKWLDMAAARLKGPLVRRGVAPAAFVTWNLLPATSQATTVPPEFLARAADVSLNTARGMGVSVASTAADRVVRSMARIYGFAIAAVASPAMAAGIAYVFWSRAADSTRPC